MALAMQAVGTEEALEALMTIVMGLISTGRRSQRSGLDTDDRRGVANADLAGAPGWRAPFLRGVPGSGARGRAGSDDRLAVRGGGVAAGRSRRSSGRAGGDGREAGEQEARQERPGGRETSARVVDDRPVAGVVDPARSHPRSPCSGAVAPHPVASARRVAAADPGSPLSPRMSAAAQPDDRGGS